MKIIILLLFFIVMCISACSQSYVINRSAQTKYPEGRELYSSKCSACHKLYSPDAFAEAEWDTILVTMKAKAKLTAEQRDAIFSWIGEIKSSKYDSLSVK